MTKSTTIISVVVLIIMTILITLATATTTTDTQQPPRYPFPPLPYPYNALEPIIGAQTMMLHHDKHHYGYLVKFQDAVDQICQGYPHLTQLFHDKTLLEVLRSLPSLPQSHRTIIRNQGGGYYHHLLFWEILRPQMPPSVVNQPLATSLVNDKIIDGWGSFGEFQQSVNLMGTQLFGSGWTIVLAMCDNETQELSSLLIENVPNQDVPAYGIPVMSIDVFEHAYYLDYQNNRGTYLNNMWKIFNWDKINDNVINACPKTAEKFKAQRGL